MVCHEGIQIGEKAEEQLMQLGYTVFVPKKWSVRAYHGRKGKYLVPAIPSMVFIYATKSSLLQAKQCVEKLQFIMSHRQEPSAIGCSGA